MTTKTFSDSIGDRAKVSSMASRRRAGAAMASSFLSLEKRIVFDGAAAAHADATFHGDPTHAHAGPAEHAGFGPTAAEPRLVASADRSASVDGMMARLASAFSSEPATNVPREIVFIDSSVPDIAAFMKGISLGAEVVMIDAGRDGVDQIAAALSGRVNISAIHLISHGSEANLELGTADLNAVSMKTTYAADLAVIKGALAPDADILVYGCDFAKGVDGDAAAHELAALTHANVAASTNLTGSTDRGGDFVLEDRVGVIHTATIDPTGYEGVLSTAQPTVVTTGGTGQFHRNLEFLTFSSLTSGLPSGSGTVATIDYSLANGGTLTATFSNVSYPSQTTSQVYSPDTVFSGGNLAQGYSSASPAPLDALTARFAGTGSMTVSFTATTKAGVSYNPDIAFLDAELTDQTEAFQVTTNGGAFKNVESVGPTPSQYVLSGVGTTTVRLTQAYDYQTQVLKGIPILVTDNATSLTIGTTMNGGFESFALALVDPAIALDGSGSAGNGGYQTTFTEKGPAVSIADSDAILTDPGTLNAANAKIVLTDAQAGDAFAIGTLPSGISSSIDTSVAGQITVDLTGSASLADYATAIKAVGFTNGSGNPSTIDREVNVTFNDGTLDSVAAVSTIHVTAVNDAPVEVAPTTLTTGSNMTVTVSGLAVSDVDANGAMETVTLSAAHGAITLASTAGLTFASGTGTSDSSETFMGTLTNINRAIAGLGYRPGANYVGSDTLAFTTDDNGNTGLGGALSTTKTVAITVVDSSHAPVTVFADRGNGLYHGNVELLTYANTSLVSGGIANGETATYQTADGGALTITFSNVVGTSNAATFKPSDLATYFGAKFATGYNASTSTSEALYGSYNGTSSFRVTFQGITKAGHAYNPNVAFIDAETTNVPEYYAVTTSGGGFQNVESVGGTGYTLAGTGTNSINLQNTTGTGVPLLVSTGVSTFDIMSKIGGGKQAFALALIVPTLDLDANDSSGKTGSGYQATFTEKGAAVAIADTDAAATEPGVANAASAKIVLTNAQAGDVMSVGSLPTGISGSVDTSVTGQITVTLSGSATLAAYQAAIGAVTFRNTSDNPSTVDRTIDVSFSDGSVDSNIAISTIHVAAINDAPLETGPGAQAISKDTALAIAGLGVSDVDANGGAETVTLSVGHGTVSLASTSGLTFTTGTGSNDGSETFTGTLAAIDQALTSVVYKPTTGFTGVDSLTFTTDDNGNTGTGGALSTSRSVAIAVANVDPSRIGTLAARVYPDGTKNLSIPTASGFFDSLGLPLSYTAAGLPSGLSIDPTTGLISGTLDHDASLTAPVSTGTGATLDGRYAIVVTASDWQGGQTTQSFTFDATNQAPVVTAAIANQSATDGQTITIQAAASFTDPNAGDVTTYAATGLPPGLSIDAATGAISGTIAATASRTAPFSVSVTATDEKAASTTESFIFSVADLPPTTTQPLSDTTIADGTSGVSIATASGFTNPLGLNVYTATGLPKGLSINATTGVISGTLDHDASLNAPTRTGSGATLVGTYVASITVVDNQGGMAVQHLTIDATNLSPIVTRQTATQHSFDGNAAALDLSNVFTDPNTGDGLSYGAIGLPTGLSIDTITGRISGTVDKSASVAAPTATGGSGTFHVVATATDDKGAARTESFDWVIDNVAPTATPPLPDVAVRDRITVSIPTVGGFIDPLGLPLAYGATGLPLGLSIDPGTGIISGTVDPKASDAGAHGIYAVQVTARDPQGGSATNPFTIVSTDAASLVPTPDQHGIDGQTIAALETTKVFDTPAGDFVVYGATGLPPGLAINPDTGAITGTIDKAASTAGPYSVTVTSTDRTSGVASTETFAWTVVTIVPVATPPLPDQAVNDSQAVLIPTVSGFTNPLGLVYTYSATGLSGLNLAIDPNTGIISGTIDHDASKVGGGVHTIAVTVDDGRGDQATNTFSIVSSNQAPIVSQATAVITAVKGTSVLVDASKAFADSNAGDTLTYTVSGLPAGLAIADPTTGLITGTVDRAQAVGLYTATIVATDDKGLSTSETVVVTIADAGGVLAPDVIPLPPVVAPEGQAIAPIDVAGHFTDPNGLPLMLTVGGLPQGLAFDPVSGQISGTIDHDASTIMPVGGYPVTVTADDGQGGVTSTVFTITSTNQAPALVAATPTRTGVVGSAFGVDTSKAFVDPNTGDTIVYAAANLPSGLAIDRGTGIVSGTIDKSVTPGAHSVIVTATDEKALATSETFSILVAAAPPVVSALPSVVAQDGLTIVPIDIAGQVTDPNGFPVTLSVLGLPRGLVFDTTTGRITGTLDHDASKVMPVGGYRITVTADNGNGGSANANLTLVSFNTAPRVVAVTNDRIVVAGSSARIDTSGAFTDLDTGDTLSYKASGLPAGLVIDPTTALISGIVGSNDTLGAYAVTVTATDDKGAATTERFDVTVSTPPPRVVSFTPIVVGDGVIIAPIDVAGHFTSSNGQPLALTVTGLPDGLIFDPASGLVTGATNHDASISMPAGGFTVVATADDGQGGGVTSTAFTITSANQPPVVVAPTLARSGTVGLAFGVDASKAFLDPNRGDTIVYTAADLPTGLDIDANTGVISGAIGKNVSPGVYAVSVIATDDKGLATPETFTLKVVADPPVIFPSPVAVLDGLVITPIDVAGHVTDPNGFPIGLTVTGLPKGLGFDPVTGLITGTIDHDASKTMPVGGYAITVTADNGRGGVTTTIFAITSTNEAPALVAPTPAQVGQPGSAFAVDASKAFVDPNTGDTLTYAASGLPLGLSIDPRTGHVTGTIDPSGSGPYTATVTATDDKGAATSEHFTITVSVPPQILVLTQNPALGDKGSIARNPSLADPPRVSRPDAFAPFDVTASAPVGTTAVARDDLGGISPFTANGIVLETVQAISGLAPLASLTVDRVVVRTVDGVSALGGLPPIDGTRGMVRDAALPNISATRAFVFAADGATREDLGAKQTDFLGASLSAVTEAREAGLESGQSDQISVETLIRENVIFIAMKLPPDAAGDAQVASYAITRANGEPLPFWLEQSRRGLVFGKLSSDRHPIDLEIIATLKNGRTFVRSVVIDPTSGRIVPAGTGRR